MMHDIERAARAHGTTFVAFRMLPTGEAAGVVHFLYTFGLCVGVTDDALYRTRYCYESGLDALHALADWDGKGDPPGPWVKQKPEERLGPGAKS